MPQMWIHVYYSERIHKHEQVLQETPSWFCAWGLNMRDRSPLAIPKSSDHDAVLLWTSHRFDSMENAIAALSDVVFSLAKGVSDFRAHSSKPWDSPVDLRLDEKTSFSHCIINRVAQYLSCSECYTASGSLSLCGLYWHE